MLPSRANPITTTAMAWVPGPLAPRHHGRLLRFSRCLHSDGSPDCHVPRGEAPSLRSTKSRTHLNRCATANLKRPRASLSWPLARCWGDAVGGGGSTDTSRRLALGSRHSPRIRVRCDTVFRLEVRVGVYALRGFSKMSEVPLRPCAVHGEARRAECL